MTTPVALPDLLSSDDVDAYAAQDADWFLKVAGDVIRDVCGWHVAPTRIEEDIACRVSANRLVMLPSRHVVSIESVTVNGVALTTDQYVWDTAGFLRLLFPPVIPWAVVSFTHGWPVLPAPVALVGVELVQQALATPNAAYTSMSAGPFRVTLASAGMVLTKDQMRVLGPYTVIDF